MVMAATVQTLKLRKKGEQHQRGQHRCQSTPRVVRTPPADETMSVPAGHTSVGDAHRRSWKAR